MREIDANIVRNLRAIYGERIAMASDEAVLAAWWDFQGTEEYHTDKDLFPEFIS